MIYLAYLGDQDLRRDVPDPPPDVPGPWREVLVLHRGLVAVDSDQSRSVVYHALKDHVGGGSPLLVTELTQVPKFKGMSAGALTWMRARLPAR